MARGIRISNIYGKQLHKLGISLPNVVSSQEIYTACHKLKEIGRRGDNWMFDIPPLEFRLSDPVRTIGVKGQAALIIGEHLKVAGGRLTRQVIVVSLVLAKCDDSESANLPLGACTDAGCLLRRFHFDIDTNDGNEDSPAFHCQIGGGTKDPGKYLPARWAEVVSTQAHKLDVPRLPSAPFDLVLVLDLFLRQFKLKEVQDSFNGDTAWNSLVRASYDSLVIAFQTEVAGVLVGGGSPVGYKRVCAAANVFSPEQG